MSSLMTSRQIVLLYWSIHHYTANLGSSISFFNMKHVEKYDNEHKKINSYIYDSWRAYQIVIIVWWRHITVLFKTTVLKKMIRSGSHLIVGCLFNIVISAVDLPQSYPQKCICKAINFNDNPFGLWYISGHDYFITCNISIG